MLEWQTSEHKALRALASENSSFELGPYSVIPKNSHLSNNAANRRVIVFVAISLILAFLWVLLVPMFSSELPGSDFQAPPGTTPA